MALKTLLHVGCGPLTLANTTQGFANDGWREIRMDVDESVKPDVLGTITDMRAVADASVDAVYSSHNIEHLYWNEVPQALAEFRRVLRAQGFAVIICPDLQAAAKLIAQDRLFDLIHEEGAGSATPFDMLFSHRALAGRDKPFMAHHCGFTASTLQDALLGCGFAMVGIVRSGWMLRAVACMQALERPELDALARRYLR